jgi:formaldehyde-activating enzyme involved in methanogenesis
MRATDAAVATPDIADKLESVINESRTKIQVAKAAAQQSPGQTSIDQALADLASGLVMVEEDEDDEF